MLSLLKPDPMLHGPTGSIYGDIGSMLGESQSNGFSYSLASTGNNGNLIVESQISHLQPKKSIILERLSINWSPFTICQVHECLPDLGSDRSPCSVSNLSAVNGHNG